MPALAESHLLRILEATRAVTSTLSLPELLKTVMRLAGEVVQSEASSLLLMDGATGELYFDVTLGEKGGALQQVRLNKGEGIAGWAAAERKSAIVNDVDNDPRWTRKADKTTQFKTRAILAVPMQVQGTVIGVMEAINRRDGAPFAETDARLLEAFASQAAVAVENARLFESIRQEKEKMSTILAQMAEGVLLLGIDGRILLANAAARTFLTGPGLGSNTWAQIEKAFSVQPSWQEIQAGAGRLELMRREPPPLILFGMIDPVLDDVGKTTGYLAVFSNVTEERREAQLKKNFLSLVSHKLRTPLVAIRGFTPMLLEKPQELNAFQKTALEAVDRNGRQLADLVDKLMWFAALEADRLELHRKPQSLPSILDAALADLASFLKAAEAAVLPDDSFGRLPLVSVDKMWMKEVFRNLVENAVKFNVRTPRQVQITAASGAEHVRVRFADNGPGIPPEERDKIFQKFYQIEGSFTGQVQGMGLGLALVKRVIEEHGGQISVESTLGQGSAFILTLPLAQPA